MSLFQFLPPPTPLGCCHICSAYICQIANPEKSTSYGASKPSPQCAFIPLLLNSLICGGALQLLALAFPLLAQGGLLRCLYLHLAQFLLQHLAHCLHLAGSQ